MQNIEDSEKLNVIYADREGASSSRVAISEKKIIAL